MAFKLPDLPYSKDALTPHISNETLEYHYGKHHNAYVTKLNNLAQGTPWENKTLEEIIKDADGGVFNNGAQVWNHTFFWHCLSPKGGGAPSGKVADAIKDAFGSVDELKEKFTTAATTLFGSGWTWLVKDASGKLTVETTSNGDNPIRYGRTPLLTCDMWEHAYYIDYRNDKGKYLDAFWNLVNWDHVAKNL